MYIEGQVNNLNMINSWGYLPNFLIIQGDSHTGKTHLVKYICEKFNMQYVLVGNSIDSVRSLLNNMVANSNILYHFKNFDKASNQAKNALLKITEETPSGNCIVVTGGKQIGTLESRARKIIMESYGENEMRSFIATKFNGNEDKLTEEKSLKYYMAGFDTPSRMLLYKDYENTEMLLNLAVKMSYKLYSFEISDLIFMLKDFKSKYESVDDAVLFLDMLIHTLNYKSKNSLEYIISYRNELKVLVNAKESLIRNTSFNRKMFLYRTFFNIIEERELGNGVSRVKK